MKILLISDTHGETEKASEIFRRLHGIDMIIHCGDYQDDAKKLMKELDIPVVSVCGNCDFDGSPETQTVETPGGRIVVTHGHRQNVHRDYNSLIYLAEENKCRAVCFGHTHIPFCSDFNGIYLINPGSISQPRDGSSGSFALITTTSDDFRAEIIYYDDFIKNKSPEKPHKKVRGGYLRDMLNYSDRF